mmetsp:Transcript_57615/g.125249  ORF Transcript_57615/g.125249 Transcript_57615/m.125249 type:complete len:286 (-) Transcript_57615:591-1448(-)
MARRPGGRAGCAVGFAHDDVDSDLFQVVHCVHGLADELGVERAVVRRRPRPHLQLHTQRQQPPCAGVHRRLEGPTQLLSPADHLGVDPPGEHTAHAPVEAASGDGSHHRVGNTPRDLAAKCATDTAELDVDLVACEGELMGDDVAGNFCALAGELDGDTSILVGVGDSRLRLHVEVGLTALHKVAFDVASTGGLGPRDHVLNRTPVLITAPAVNILFEHRGAFCGRERLRRSLLLHALQGDLAGRIFGNALRRGDDNGDGLTSEVGGSVAGEEHKLISRINNVPV